TDQDQAELQERFAPHLVTDMAEHDPAQGPGDEAHGIGGKGSDDAIELVARFGKEELAEYQCGRGPVEKELVPLDHRAGHRCADDLPQIGEVRLFFVPHVFSSSPSISPTSVD